MLRGTQVYRMIKIFNPALSPSRRLHDLDLGSADINLLVPADLQNAGDHGAAIGGGE